MDAMTALGNMSNEELEIKQLKRCNQKGCNNEPFYRFTWPGRDEAAICRPCSGKMLAVAEAIGMRVQLIHLDGK